MKTTFKIMGLVAGLGLVLLLSLHLFLQYGLTRAMREVVLPRIRQETGIDLRVGGLSINLPKGQLAIREIEVRNPEGFLLENLASVGRVVLEVDLLRLLKDKTLAVHDLEIEGGVVNIVRDREGVTNLERLEAGLAQPPLSPSLSESASPGSGQPALERAPGTVRQDPVPRPVEPLPEMIVEHLKGDAIVRYVDFRLNQYDIALRLDIEGRNLSTVAATDSGWGDLRATGALGSDRTSFVTDLAVRMAPLTDLQAPSFDLAGKIMEIDPRILEKVYGKAGIRSAPFGIDPVLHCRRGWFEDSTVSLHLRDVKFEEKLARRMGGMGTIGSLRFSVPVGGSLQQPEFDLSAAMLGAVGGNMRSVLDAWLMGAAGQQGGTGQAPAGTSDAAIEALGEKIDEIGRSETAKRILKDLADGEPSATNAPSPASSDVLVDLLGEQVEEIGENEALKKDLKDLGRKLFGR